MCEAPEDRGHAKDETDAEADEIKGVHGHCLPRLLGLREGVTLCCVVETGAGFTGREAPASGRSTWSRRSTSEGVSSTASSNRRHRRESLFWARVSSAWH